MTTKTLLTLTLFVSISMGTASAIPVNFAVATPTSSTPQFSILNNPAGTVTVTASGQDFFTYLVGGTPFVGPVLANFTFTATSTSAGTCGSIGCPNGDTLSEQGFTGSFQYTVASGPFIGSILLAGTFNTNATPANSGGNLLASINGTGGSFGGTQTGGNPTGVLMSSTFLSFAAVGNEAATFAFSAGAPNFSVNPTVTNISFPTTGQIFTFNHSDTFSSEPAPTGAPEPATMALLGSALIGIGMVGRKRFSR